MRRAGFTLIEVLLALLIVTVGVLALLGTFAPLTRLAAEGREQGRIAMAMESRLQRIRAEAGADSCPAATSGTARSPDGVVESWHSAVQGDLVEILITARVEGRPRPPDSALSRIRCP